MQNKNTKGRGFVVLSSLLTIVGLSTGLLVSTAENTATPTSAGLVQLVRPVSFAASQTTREVDLLFTGDVMLARSIGQRIEADEDPFAYVQSTIDEHDISVANIETTIADPSIASQAAKPYTFNAPLSSLQTLKNAGIDVSSLANNHTGDFGRLATQDTIDQFASVGLVTVGAGSTIEDAFQHVLVTEQGISVAFIAVNDIELVHTKVSDGVAGSAYLDRDLIANSIQRAKRDGADAVVILPHWGIEYSPVASAQQTEWGRFMIDSGADLVIGGHPHVVQPTEHYNGGQIVYSLGNFIFDGMPANARIGQMASVSITVDETYVANTMLEKDVLIGDLESIPIEINSQGFPELR